MFPNAASEVRQVDPDYVDGQYETLFSDGYPFLLISQVSKVAVGKWKSKFTYINLYSVFVIYDFQESLDALNELVEEPIPMNRFRPKYWFFHVFLYTVCTYIIS